MHAAASPDPACTVLLGAKCLDGFQGHAAWRSLSRVCGSRYMIKACRGWAGGHSDGWFPALHGWSVGEAAVLSRCVRRGADLQAYLAAGAQPSKSLEMAVRAPSSYGITTMPQPQSAGLMLYNALNSDTSGARRCIAWTLPCSVRILCYRCWETVCAGGCCALGGATQTGCCLVQTAAIGLGRLRGTASDENGLCVRAGQLLYQQANASYMPPPVQQTPILSADVMARGAGGGPEQQAQPRKQNNASALRGAVQSARQAAAGMPSLLHPVNNLAAPSPLVHQQQQGRQSPGGRRLGFRPGLPPLSEHPPSRPQSTHEDDDG